MPKAHWILFALALGAAGCAKERTLDDYNHERVQEELSKMDAVRGSYRGTLVSKKDQSTLGAFQIDVDSDAKVESGSSGATTTQQASLQGSITIQSVDGSTRILAFKQGYFDPINYDFRAEVDVQQPNGQAATVELSGNFSGDTLTGEIESSGYTEDGATFALTRNGPMPDSQSLRASAGAAAQPTPLLRAYGATVSWRDGSRSDVTLTVLNPVTTTDQQFLDVFQPVKTVTVGISSQPVGDTPGWGLANTRIANAQWDYRTGTLTGEGTSQAAGGSYDVLLSCTQVMGPGDELDLSCQYASAQEGLLFSTVFHPAQAAGSR